MSAKLIFGIGIGIGLLALAPACGGSQSQPKASGDGSSAERADGEEASASATSGADANADASELGSSDGDSSTGSGASHGTQSGETDGTSSGSSGSSESSGSSGSGMEGQAAGGAEPAFTEDMSVDQAINVVPRGGERRNIDPETLGKPLQSLELYEPCKPGSAKVKVRVAVWGGKAVGVDVTTTPKNDKLAQCIKSKVREITWEKKVKSLNTIEYQF